MNGHVGARWMSPDVLARPPDTVSRRTVSLAVLAMCFSVAKGVPLLTSRLDRAMEQTSTGGYQSYNGSYKVTKYLAVRQREPTTTAEWDALHVALGAYVKVQGMVILHTGDKGFPLGLLLVNSGNSKEKMYALLGPTWGRMAEAGKARCYLAVDNYQRYYDTVQWIVRRVRARRGSRSRLPSRRTCVTRRRF